MDRARRLPRLAATTGPTAAGLALAVIALAACDDDTSAIASQGSTLTQLTASTVPAPPETTAAPATTAPAPTEPATTTTVFVEPVAGCLDYLQFQIQAGQPEAVELWQEDLDESDEALTEYCEELATSDPDRVQEMIEEKRVIDEFIAQAEAATTTTE